MLGTFKLDMLFLTYIHLKLHFKFRVTSTINLSAETKDGGGGNMRLICKLPYPHICDLFCIFGNITIQRTFQFIKRCNGFSSKHIKSPFEFQLTTKVSFSFSILV